MVIKPSLGLSFHVSDDFATTFIHNKSSNDRRSRILRNRQHNRETLGTVASSVRSALELSINIFLLYRRAAYFAPPSLSAVSSAATDKQVGVTVSLHVVILYVKTAITLYRQTCRAERFSATMRRVVLQRIWWNSRLAK